MITENKFDTVITVFPRFRIALMLFYAGIRTRIGTGYRWYSFLFNKKIYEHRKYGEKHELIHNINLLKPLGIEDNITEENCVYGISPTIKNKETVAGFLKANQIDLNRKTIIFHPGSGGSAVDLPMDKMKLLVLRCAEELDADIIITGDKKEEAICGSFPKRENIYNLCGKFNLGELTALIDNCDILAANSTGPLHMAAALGKHVIGFFPKIRAMSPKRWAPYTTKKDVFVPPVNCTECSRKQCAELDCMNHISTDEVFDAIKKVVNNAGN
jgi:ADP-heptose:LPS heptosyltransferase